MEQWAVEEEEEVFGDYTAEDGATDLPDASKFFMHDDDEYANSYTSEDDDDEDEKSSKSEDDEESCYIFTFDGEDDESCFASDEREDGRCFRLDGDESWMASSIPTKESSSCGIQPTTPLFSTYNETWKYDRWEVTTKNWDNTAAQYHELRPIHENELLTTVMNYVEGDHPHTILPDDGLRKPNIERNREHKDAGNDLVSCTNEAASIAVVTVEGDLSEENRDDVPTFIGAPTHYLRKPSHPKPRVRRSILYVRMGQLRILPYRDIGRKPKRGGTCTDYADIEPQSIQKCNMARAATSRATRKMCEIVYHLRKKGI